MSGAVREKLSSSLAVASKADRTIANFMLSELSNLPFETAASLAAKVEVSEPTVGRFCRTLGFKSFKDLKDALRKDFDDKPWLVSDRLRDLRDRAEAGEEQLAAGLELEISALVAIYEIARTEEWARVVRRLSTMPNVYAAGFQTERGMAQILVNQLQYLRDGVRLLDLAGGSFAELLASDPAQSCLVIFEARRYSRLSLELAKAAKSAGIPVTLVTDPFCDWGRHLTDEMFVVPTEFNQFWESTAQMASLANLLVNGVFLELGPKVEARMETVTQLYSQFIGYVGKPGNRTSQLGSNTA